MEGGVSAPACMETAVLSGLQDPNRGLLRHVGPVPGPSFDGYSHHALLQQLLPGDGGAFLT